MKRVWIDTDVAIGAPDARGGHADVDDAFAIIQLFKASNIEVVGIGTVFGNTFIENATQIAKDLSQQFGPLPEVPVYEGASGPMDLGKLQHNEATLALKQALEKEKLHILAIGPATNIGTLMLLEPALVGQIEQVILVAGRRSLDHHFKVSPEHQPPFPDLNFDLDPNAFRVLIQQQVSVVLHPYEISSKVWVTQEDLHQLSTGDPAARFLAEKSIPWLNQWKTFTDKGFNPFDVLASAYLVDESYFEYEDLAVHMQIAVDDVSEHTGTYKPYLILSPDQSVNRVFRYCYSTKEGFKEWLWEMLKN